METSLPNSSSAPAPAVPTPAPAPAPTPAPVRAKAVPTRSRPFVDCPLFQIPVSHRHPGAALGTASCESCSRRLTEHHPSAYPPPVLVPETESVSALSSLGQVREAVASRFGEPGGAPTVQYLSCCSVVVHNFRVPMGSLVELRASDDTDDDDGGSHGPTTKRLRGVVVAVCANDAVVEVFGKLPDATTTATFTVQIVEHSSADVLSSSLLEGRVLSGCGGSLDGLTSLETSVMRALDETCGTCYNVAVADYPRDRVHTGISSIDLMNTLPVGASLLLLCDFETTPQFSATATATATTTTARTRTTTATTTTPAPANSSSPSSCPKLAQSIAQAADLVAAIIGQIAKHAEIHLGLDYRHDSTVPENVQQPWIVLCVTAPTHVVAMLRLALAGRSRMCLVCVEPHHSDSERARAPRTAVAIAEFIGIAYVTQSSTPERSAANLQAGRTTLAAVDGVPPAQLVQLGDDSREMVLSCGGEDAYAKAFAGSQSSS
eukprot:gnl/Spiro4/6341_TR3269_c0_g1_i1.p1 gnl/Spiro4/6341_TR3269_c0_g1~~gnl/Spiro4/6341_TR3269_c0_g1_i1.p1  ORF type:complete len:504 (-),score=63.24 gnl/Spiro4/6341_TR3269_c0_g1_i1:53-1525(-)